MAIEEVKVVSVPVSDQERAKAFYVEKLGFQLTRDDDSIPGIRWVQVTPKRGTTSFTLVTWFEFDRPLQQQPWGEEAVIRDPDGNKIVLQQIG